MSLCPDPKPVKSDQLPTAKELALHDPALFWEWFADPWWRLSNLYHVIDEDGQAVLYKPNQAQMLLYRGMHYRNLIPKARQRGVTTGLAILALDKCLAGANIRCGIIAHTRESSAKIFRDKIQFAFANLPEVLQELYKPVRDEAGELLLANNSGIRVGTSFESSTTQFLHITEFGILCSRFPKKAREVVIGSLPTIHGKGQIWLEGTIEGKEGLFFDMIQASQRPQAGSKLSNLSYKLFFLPWWGHDSYRSHDASYVIPERLNEYFSKLKADSVVDLDRAQRVWYARQELTIGADIFTQYPSTLEESMRQIVEGAYYKAQMDKVYAEERVRELSYNPAFHVNTYWDIGMDDTNTIWFVQDIGPWHHVIDYYEASGEGLGHYVGILKDKPYRYGQHIAPHDISVREWTNGMSRIETARLEHGIRFDTAPNLSVMDGIDAVRRILASCVFDGSKCEKGLNALCGYRKEWDADHGVWKNKPAHDSASHGADSFRYFAVSPANRSMSTGSRVERWAI